MPTLRSSVVAAVGSCYLDHLCCNSTPLNNVYYLNFGQLDKGSVMLISNREMYQSWTARMPTSSLLIRGITRRRVVSHVAVLANPCLRSISRLGVISTSFAEANQASFERSCCEYRCSCKIKTVIKEFLFHLTLCEFFLERYSDMDRYTCFSITYEAMQSL